MPLSIGYLTGDIPRNDPESDVVVLETIDVRSSRGGVYSAGARIKTWLSYRFNSHFTTPTDGWSMQVAADELTKAERSAIVPGAEIRLSINGHTQATGYIDHISYSADRGSGLVWQIEGRDKLAPAIDSMADPSVQFKAGRSLLDFLQEVFAPFGWSVAQGFDPDNDANRDVLSGHGGAQNIGARGQAIKSQERSISAKGRRLNSFTIHQLRPHANEGAFAFAARVTNRFGLRIWPAADGQTLIVGQPEYNQSPRYTLIRRKDGRGSNILSGTVQRNLSEQPSAIVADGFSGGGEFGKGRVRTVMVNPAVDTPGTDDFVSLWKSKGANVITSSDYEGPKLFSKVARPAYLHDDEAKTQEDLDNFVQREMSHRLQKVLTASYTFAGHVLNDSIMTVDTIVRVIDEAAELEEDLWVMSRTFNKSRASGTTTEVELVRKGSLEF